MSRSYRKTKVFPWTCSTSEKQDKTICHKATRRIERQMLKNFDVDMHIPTYKELFDPWDWAKDGKQYWNDATKKDMRK